MGGDRYWVVDPIAHRIEWRENLPVDGSVVVHPDFGEMVNIVPVPPPDDEWICDMCNAEIPLAVEGHSHLWVPFLGSYALCPDCFRKNGGDEAWFVHESSFHVCSCDACKAWMEKVVAEHDAERI